MYYEDENLFSVYSVSSELILKIGSPILFHGVKLRESKYEVSIDAELDS